MPLWVHVNSPEGMDSFPACCPSSPAGDRALRRGKEVDAKLTQGSRFSQRALHLRGQTLIPARGIQQPGSTPELATYKQVGPNGDRGSRRV